MKNPIVLRLNEDLYSQIGNSGISLELSNISGLAYLPYRKLEAYPVKGIENTRLTIRKSFDNNNSLSLSIGDETFQMYDINWDGANPIFTKETSILWGGVGYKYTATQFNPIKNLSPYSEIILGLSKYGALSKCSLGFIYNSDDLFTFSVGIEGMMQTYQMQSKIRAAGKIGLVYMLGIKF